MIQIDERIKNQVVKNNPTFKHYIEKQEQINQCLEELGIEKLSFLNDGEETKIEKEITLKVIIGYSTPEDLKTIDNDTTPTTDYLATLGLTKNKKNFVIENEGNKILLYIKNQNTIVATFNFLKTKEGVKIVLDEIKKLKIQKQDLKSLMVKNITSIFNEKSKEKIRQHEETIKSKKQNIEEYERKIVENFQQMFQAEKTLELYANKKLQEKVEKEVNELMDIPVIHDLQIEGNSSLIFEMRDIKIRGVIPTKKIITKEGVTIKEEKVTYVVPLMKFVINIREGEGIKVYGLEKVYSGYYHPHISDQDTPCFGALKEQILRAKENLELVLLVELLYSWARSYSPDTNPHCKLERLYYKTNNIESKLETITE